MPYSSPSGKSLIDRAIIRVLKRQPDFFKHHHVIDIGCGSGTYVERYGKSWLPRSKFKWTGVEIWEPYIDKFKLTDKYDEILMVEALDYLKTTTEKADICFLGDVIEHMTKEHAKAVIDAALCVSSMIVVSIPIGHYPQDEYEGNPFEKHITDNWTMVEAFNFLPHVKFYAQDNEIGVFICSSSQHQLFQLLTAKIGVYGICKNELSYVDNFMHSIADADDIVICDTGSTDGTYEKFYDWADARDNMKVERIHVNPWRFDDARNCSLMLLPEDLDVCISIDLDEQLEPGWYQAVTAQVTSDIQIKGKPLDRYNHRFRSIWNWDKPNEQPNISEHWHERIHARHGFMWKLPVHEILTKADGTTETAGWLNSVWMTQRPDLSKPRSSYLKLLEQSVQEDPTVWKSWSFLAGEYVSAGQYDKAIEAIDKARALPKSDKAHLAYQASNIYRHIGKSDSAIWELLNAIQCAPNIREYRVYLAEYYLTLNRHYDALSQLELAEKITTKTNGYTFNPRCWDQGFDNLISSVRSKESK